MSRSNDAGHFFQTSDALATTERKQAKAKNKHGDPIKLPSKILAARSAGESSNAIYIAEAAGDVKRVNLETRKIEKIFTQSSAPLTCLDLDHSGNVFAGSWDKTIYYVPQDGSAVRQFTGHTDFIKCLLWTNALSPAHPILLSGSADATIIVWDLSPSSFGKQLHKLKGHTKALQSLAIDRASLTDDDDDGDRASFTLFSASSDREIRRWHISLPASHELPDSTILAHDTSVYGVRVDGEGDLWTCSADKTAKHLVRGRDWEADTTLAHPDFVRDVVAFEELGLVVTACRDEEVRVWEITSGKLVCAYGGHFEEVTALVRLGPRRVVSVSIDGTVRSWSLERGEMVKYLEEVERERSGVEAADEKKQTEGMLTAEEEAELAELMEDDD